MPEARLQGLLSIPAHFLAKGHASGFAFWQRAKTSGGGSMKFRMVRRTAAEAAIAVLVFAACATPGAEQAQAPKGYVIAEIAVTHPEPYEAYKAAVGPMVAAFGGRYLVRGGQTQSREGAEPAGRIVVLEFPSFEAAQAFNDSPEYAAIVHLRTDNAVSRVMIVEGTGP